MIDSSVTIKRGCDVLFVRLLQETGVQQRQQMNYRSKSAPIRWKEGDCVKSRSTVYHKQNEGMCVCVSQIPIHPRKRQYTEETKLPEGSVERPCLVLLIREPPDPVDTIA
mmetsp:Transcript_42573/g.47383  ORF Transcript_42573/g.47383 Transcript_42573/m.47383 type:complete len:110 (+) Transcript_42573:153-482(+)